MCSLIWSICDDNFLLLRTKNNNDNFHSKFFDFFNNKSRIMFLWRRTVNFAESYSDPKDEASWFFDDKNGLKYLWIKCSSSLINI